MKSEPLKPGDVVIELAGLTRTCGMVAGGIASSASAWMAQHSVLYAAIALIVGGILGYFISIPIGKWLFFSPKGKIIVAKKGKQSLPKTLRASLPSSLASAFAGSVAVGILTKATNLGMILIVAMIVGIVMGTILAFLSSLA
jgi:hypothetical protein